MSGRYIFKFATKKAGCKGPDSYNGDVVWDESDGPVHLKFWSGKEYVRLSDMVRNEVDKYMKETNRMNERPTPETDAEHAQFKMGGFTLDFCQKLERERDEAREALRTLAEHGENEIQKLIKECDEARNKMADALQEVDLRTLDYERMKQERDEARERAAKWESSFDAMERAGAEQALRADENREWALREARIAIIATLEENRHLADGGDCTLAKLKSVVPEWK